MKIGDYVQRITDDYTDSSTGNTVHVGDKGKVVGLKDNGTDVSVQLDNGRLIKGAAYSRFIVINEAPKSMSLKDKFALAFKGEPERSFIRAGVMNTDETLTTDGEAIFMAFLLKKYGDDFKKEVVDPILAEEDKNAGK